MLEGEKGLALGSVPDPFGMGWEAEWPEREDDAGPDADALGEEAASRGEGTTDGSSAHTARLGELD